MFGFTSIVQFTTKNTMLNINYLPCLLKNILLGGGLPVGLGGIHQLFSLVNCNKFKIHSYLNIPLYPKNLESFEIVYLFKRVFFSVF